MARRSLEPWDRSEPADEPAPSVAGPPVPAEIPPAEPTAWDGPLSPKVGRIDGSTVRRGPARKARKTVTEGARYIKLDAAARAEIRRRARKGELPGALAREWGVHRRTIQDLLRGRTFGHDNAAPVAPTPNEPAIGEHPSYPPAPVAPVPEPEPAGPPPPRRGRAPRLDAAARAEARELARQGWGVRRLARHFGVARSVVWRCLKGHVAPGDPDAPAPPPRPHRWIEDRSDPMTRDPMPPAIVAEEPDQVVDIGPPAIVAEARPVDGWGHWSRCRDD